MLSQLNDILEKKGRALHYVPPHASVLDAARRMKELGVGALLVTEESQLLGIFTERDLLVRVVAEGLDPSTTAVSAVMTPEPQCVSPFITVENAMHVITDKRFRHLPVVEGDHLEGMITIGDLARWMVGAQKTQLEELVRAVKGVTLR
ncbi:MAG: CBS domain-containing protein [Gammaproteobacteria bacterium]